MSRLKVNDEDYTRRLKNFKVECPACGRDNASLCVEYRLHLEGWCNIWIKCDTCEHLHMIFDSYGELNRAEYLQKKKGEKL